jgi:hypothetical protein
LRKKPKMKVSEVLTRLRELGLDVSEKTKTGHYKVSDPKTGALLLDISGTPSDMNWYHQVSRDLRRIGLSLDASKVRRKSGVVKHPAVDLEALKKAQEAARAAGEREPQLSDLDEAPSTSPLWKRTRLASVTVLNNAAQQEVITNMVPRAESNRVKYLRGRLHNFMLEKGDELDKAARKRNPNTRPGMGRIAEFARVAHYEVAPAREMRSWKNDGSAAQAIHRFTKTENSGMALWGLALIEATMDHINGMKWGTYEIPEPEKYPIAAEVEEAEAAKEDEPVIPEEPQQNEPEDEPVKPDSGLWVSSSNIVRELPSHKDRYIEALLKMLESGSISDEVIAMEVMPRLDKLLLQED